MVSLHLWSKTLRNKVTSNFGSSRKPKSSKPELPCISGGIENMDKIRGTFQQGIGLERMSESITSGQPAGTVGNTNPSTSVVQDGLASEKET